MLERRAEGVTDYLATPLFFTDGTIHLATWTSRRRGGLSDLQIAGIEAIVAPLARVAEIWTMRRTAVLCSTPMSGGTPVSVSWPGKFDAATSKRSTPRSGCRTCAGSPLGPTASRRGC